MQNRGRGQQDGHDERQEPQSGQLGEPRWGRGGGLGAKSRFRRVRQRPVSYIWGLSKQSVHSQHRSRLANLAVVRQRTRFGSCVVIRSQAACVTDGFSPERAIALHRRLRRCHRVALSQVPRPWFRTRRRAPSTKTLLSSGGLQRQPPERAPPRFGLEQLATVKLPRGSRGTWGKSATTSSLAQVARRRLPPPSPCGTAARQAAQLAAPQVGG